VLLILLAACSLAPESPSQGVVLPAATLTLGPRPGEPCAGTTEPGPAVQVAALEVDPTEATQQSWAALPGLPDDPSFGPRCPTCPVDSLTHSEARAYCAARSVAQGLPACDTCTPTPEGLACTAAPGECTGFRLPTGAELERIARAGRSTSTWAGDVTVCMRHDPVLAPLGWTKTTSGGQPQPVAQRSPTPDGIYDVVGNLAEWTADEATATGLRSLRGGSWYHNAEHARASAVLTAPPERRFSWAGVRCVRTLP
jgi:formylglycine-generating enzyme required for sulfatase activity